MIVCTYQQFNLHHNGEFSQKIWVEAKRFVCGSMCVVPEKHAEYSVCRKVIDGAGGHHPCSGVPGLLETAAFQDLG